MDSRLSPRPETTGTELDPDQQSAPRIRTASSDASTPGSGQGTGPGPSQATLLVVDDDDLSRATLCARLELLGYRVHAAGRGARALEMLEERDIDLVLFNAAMTDMKGDEILEHRRSAARLRAIPFLVIAGPTDMSLVARCIEAGAEDYVTKPFDTFLLEARIGACLDRRRLRELESAYQAVVQAQAGDSGHPPLQPSPARGEGEHARPGVGGGRQTEDRDSDRLARLRRFLSPQIVELIGSSGDEHVLESHRREITVAFCDLRGFTAFAESAEPEDVMSVLREYHAAMGEIIFEHQGTLERFTGDGMMVFFNDPVPLPDPAGQAARMAVAMRDRALQLAARWLDRGYDLGFGMGIAMGYATLGRIGFEGRFDYGAIGSVTNLASRLCDEAAAGQILISRRVWSLTQDLLEVEAVGRLQLKGFRRPVDAFNVTCLKGTPT